MGDRHLVGVVFALGSAAGANVKQTNDKAAKQTITMIATIQAPLMIATSNNVGMTSKH